MSGPPKFFICLTPVGHVTLISVKYFPITSIPTKTRFISFKVGFIASHILMSLSDNLDNLGIPPTPRFDLNSPFAGILLHT